MPQTPPFKGQLNSGYNNNNLFQSREEAYLDLYYQDHSLVSGSLEALIHHLVPTVDYYPDVSSSGVLCGISHLLWFLTAAALPVCLQRSYIFTFLLSSRLFIQPHELMCEVRQLCLEQQRPGDPPADKVSPPPLLFCPRPLLFASLPVFSRALQLRLKKITPRVLQLLTEWTESFPYDFRDDRMMRSLKELTHRLSAGEEVSSWPLLSLTAACVTSRSDGKQSQTQQVVFKEKPRCSGTRWVWRG